MSPCVRSLMRLCNPRSLWAHKPTHKPLCGGLLMPWKFGNPQSGQGNFFFCLFPCKKIVLDARSGPETSLEPIAFISLSLSPYAPTATCFNPFFARTCTNYPPKKIFLERRPVMAHLPFEKKYYLTALIISINIYLLQLQLQLQH